MRKRLSLVNLCLFFLNEIRFQIVRIDVICQRKDVASQSLHILILSYEKKEYLPN